MGTKSTLMHLVKNAPAYLKMKCFKFSSREHIQKNFIFFIILVGLALAILVDMPQIKFIFAYPIKDTIF